MRSNDLTRVPSEELQRLLRAAYHKTLASPITRSGLIASTFGHIEQPQNMTLAPRRAPAASHRSSRC
jgi:hypothetical protein